MSFHYRKGVRTLLPFLAVAAWAQPPDLVLANGDVWTGATVNARPFRANIAIRGDRIVAVGGNLKAGPHTKVIDVSGRFVMPGFNDAHIHFGAGSERLTEVDLTGICTVPAIQAKIAEFAAAHPEAPWIRGGGWEYTCFPEGLPTRQQIDAVVKDRPVFLSAYDGHTGWANSKALELAKLGKGHRYEGFGEVVLDPDTQEPTGCLKEGAQGLVRRLLPRRSRQERLNALRAGLKYAASLGITSIQNASGSPEEVELYDELYQAGELTVRTSISMSAGQMTTVPDVIAGWVELSKKFRGPVLKVGAVKFVLDGVVESHTAAMLDLYADGSKTQGRLSWKPEEYRQAMIRVDKAGLQIYTHAIGDGAVRAALDGYEAVRQANGPRDSRHRIEHIEVISARDVARFGPLGVLASMEPIHCDPDTVALWSKAVGPERLKLAFPWRSLQAAGAKLVFSSDWPASISLDPVRGIHNAVNRQTIAGKPAGGWIPEQRVSLETALHGYTSMGAYAEFEEKRKGTIAVGKLADLIVLDRNPFAIPASELHSLRVQITVFAGRVIYDRAAK